MRVKIHSRKCCATALLVAVCFSSGQFLLMPNKAEAIITLDAGDALSIPIKSFSEAATKMAHTGLSKAGFPIPFTSLDHIMKLATKQIINKMNSSIVGWVNTGNVTLNEEGKPEPGSFLISNLSVFLDGIGKKTATESIGSRTSNLCGSWSEDIAASLSKEFGLSDVAGGGRSACKDNELSQQNTFVQGNFIDGGGWDTWSKITQDDTRNPYGAYLTTRSQVQADVAKQQAMETEKLRQNNGVQDARDSKGKITVPGSVIKDMLTSTLTSELRQLENAKYFDDIVTAFTSSMTNKLIGGNIDLAGIGAAFGGGNSESGENETSGGNSMASGRYERPDYEGITQQYSSESESSSVNIAPQGTATQSGDASTAETGHGPERALTGSSMRNRDWGVSITRKQANPWWQVDFGQSKTISKIVLVPPTDYTFEDIYVYVSVNPLPHDIVQADKNTWRSGPLSAGEGREITITEALRGRYVKVQKADSAAGTQLELAGVEVYATDTLSVVLMGAKEMRVARGTEFIDPGATVINGDDFITSKVKRVPVIFNTETPGTYTLRYSIISKGVTASATRTVIVE